MMRLPEDIITMSILKRLPVKPLYRFRLVSKSWGDLIISPNFAKMHLNHTIEEKKCNMMLSCFSMLNGYSVYSINSDSFDKIVKIDYPLEHLNFTFCRLLGSCNGLIGISQQSSTVCVWNPTTSEYKELPLPPMTNPYFPPDYEYFNDVSFGIGYDSKNDDHKFVRLLTSSIGYGIGAQIFSLKLNSWKTVEGIQYDPLYVHSRPDIGFDVFVNDCLHWIVTPSIGTKPSNVVIAFDIVEERFTELLLPEDLDTKFDSINLCVLDGYLCFVTNVYDSCTEVWVMKDYGVRQSWTKIFTIDQRKFPLSIQYLIPKQSLKNGDLLLETDGHKLILYDPCHGTTKVLNFNGIFPGFAAVNYLESLVSLNSGTFVGQKETDEALQQRRERQDGVMRYEWPRVRI